MRKNSFLIAASVLIFAASCSKEVGNNLNPQAQIKSKSPMALYVLWGNSTIKNYVQDVRENYGRTKGRTIRFDQSFGFTFLHTLGNALSLGSLYSFLPSSYKIEEIDVFGAAKYGGNWKGVRISGKN
ncbi:MAG: hypothetical protein LBG92_00655 [Prevotellaceae bacterium]|jgi:hypothetical protein|nr:hypothetical protein [Prevotellaceae bacterium]